MFGFIDHFPIQTERERGRVAAFSVETLSWPLSWIHIADQRRQRQQRHDDEDNDNDLERERQSCSLFFRDTLLTYIMNCTSLLVSDLLKSHIFQSLPKQLQMLTRRCYLLWKHNDDQNCRKVMYFSLYSRRVGPAFSFSLFKNMIDRKIQMISERRQDPNPLHWCWYKVACLDQLPISKIISGVESVWSLLIGDC